MKPNELMNILSNIFDSNDIQQQEISEEEIMLLLEAFKQATSMDNVQSGELYLVYSHKIKMKLLNSTLDAFGRDEKILKPGWILEAPLVIILCINVKRARARLGEKGDNIAKMDVWGGVQNLKIIARMLNIGTNIARNFEADKISEILYLPKYIVPIGIIGLGYLKNEEVENIKIRPMLDNSLFIHEIKEE